MSGQVEGVSSPALHKPYSHELYHSNIKLTLGAACAEFERRNAQPLVNVPVRDIFLKHGVEDKFSACLLHRHFDLSPNERNVEDNSGHATASADLDGTHPASWMYVANEETGGVDLYPWEYKREPTPMPPAGFVKEYGELLKKHGMCDLLGFQVYTDEVVGVESTDVEHRISTTVEYPETGPIPDGLAAASWAFFR